MRPVKTEASSIELSDTNKFKPLKFGRVQKIKLLSSLCTPSYVHAYSLCIGYMKKWFLDHFPENYFKTIYIEGKHVIDEYKKYNNKELVKRAKPALAIVPNPDLQFDNENLNWKFGDINMNSRITNNRDVFFSDRERNIYIGCINELMLINFNYKMKVNTKAKQIDLFKFLQFNVGDRGTTSGRYVDMDFHLPYDLMIQLAKDAGFQVMKDGSIPKIIEFLNYLNTHSTCPIICKLRNINGKNEFFVRQVNYIHIREPEEISVDDGERQGFVSSNYVLEYAVEVRFPAPMYYRYFSEIQHDQIKELDADGNITAYYTSFDNIPQKNLNGWDRLITTDCECDDLDTPLEIDLTELFDGTNLLEVKDFILKQHLNPAVFIELKLFNNGQECPIVIDWETMVLKTIGLVLARKSRIAVYIDYNFLNTQTANIREYYSNRQIDK